MKVLWLINAPIPALCERAGLPVQVKEGWIEGLYNSLMALVREKKQDFEIAMAFPQFSRSETVFIRKRISPTSIIKGLKKD